jgi:hypothetical protein
MLRLRNLACVLFSRPAPVLPEPLPAPDPVARFRDMPDKMLRDFDILAFDQGLLATMQGNLPVDAAGAPIPWFTYPAIEYLGQFDFQGMNIFEFGCGNSSHYWTRRGAVVWSVDHDEDWHRKMCSEASPAQTFYLGQDPESYLRAIERPGIAFDVVLIDGILREECVAPAIAHLRRGGFIILDNADRDAETGRLLRARDFFEVDFNGFGPINDYTWTTAIFLPPGGTDLRIARRPRPIGGHPNVIGDG